MSGQQTVSSQDDHLSGQTFGLPVILIDMQVNDQKKELIFKPLEDKHLFTLCVCFLG